MTQSNEHHYSNGITDARTLGWPKTILLGLQHTFAMFGATVLVHFSQVLAYPLHF